MGHAKSFRESKIASSALLMAGDFQNL